MIAAEVQPIRPLPFGQGFAVTPSNTTTYSPPLDGLLCAGAPLSATGIVRVDLADGGGTVDIPVSHGWPVDKRTTKVHLTGTTALNIVGLRRVIV